MYKVYIETGSDGLSNPAISDTTQITELAKMVGRELLKVDNVIVHINGLNIDRSELLELNLDAFVRLQDESATKGPEVMINELSKVSNGIGKEIYRELQKIYYNKNIDKGVMYIKEKVGVEDVPSVIVNVISRDDLEDRNWLQTNMEDTARAISCGILTSFKLKKC